MNFQNLKHAASLLKTKGFTEKNPLVLSSPVVIFYWYDTRHYSEEIPSDKVVSLWQKGGCVYTKTTTGLVKPLQKTVTYEINTNYYDSVSPVEEHIVDLIAGHICDTAKIESMQNRLDEIYDGIAKRDGMNISYTDSMDGSTFPSVLTIADGFGEKDDYDNCRFLAEAGRILPESLKDADNLTIRCWILANSESVFETLMNEAEYDGR